MPPLIVLVPVLTMLILPVLLIAFTLFFARAIIVLLLFQPLIMFRVAFVHKIFGIPAITDRLLIVTILIRTIFLSINPVMQVRLIFINNNFVSAI